MNTITLTDNLVQRIRTLRAQDGRLNLKLRVTVDGGGCQGFEYRFDLTEAINSDDKVFEKEDVSVIIDDISLPYMQGAEIDYVDDLIGAHFEIRNPNAKSSCGCGTSFSV